MASEYKRLNDIIKPHGLEFVRHKRHGAIHRISDGKRLVTCSGSPSDPYWWRQVVRDLIKYKHMPPGKYW